MLNYDDINVIVQKAFAEYRWKCLHTFLSDVGWSYGVSITPDAQTLISIYNNKIRIWDLNSGELNNVLSGHSRVIYSHAVSPDSQSIASGSKDRTVKLWDLQTGRLKRTLSLREDPIYSVAFSPDGTIIASGGSNKYKRDEGKTTIIYLWCSETGELIDTLSAHSQRVNCLTFSTDGHILASGSNDGTIKVWNLDNKQHLYTLAKDADCVKNITITPNRKTLISSGYWSLNWWNLTTGELLYSLYIDPEHEYITDYAVSPDGEIIITPSGTFIEVCYSPNGDIIDLIIFPAYNFINKLEDLCPFKAIFSPDGKKLATYGSVLDDYQKNLIKVWQMPICLTSETKQQNNTKFNTLESLLEEKETFNPEDIEDTRKLVNTSVVQRQGQALFRKELLTAYKNLCAITDCDVEQALEAAHIVPYLGIETNHPSNGLLLRADIHTLFDLHLISVNPETMTIEINPSLINTCYSELYRRRLRVPEYKLFQPSIKAIKRHYLAFLQKQIT